MEYNVINKHIHCPVVLYTSCGNRFEAIGLRGMFKTPFFLVTNINKNNGALTLRLLKECNRCHGFVLIPTDDMITIDCHSICGIQALSVTCIKCCNHNPLNMHNCICGPFSIRRHYKKTVLWKSNLTVESNGIITLNIKEGHHISLTLRIYTLFGNFKEYRLTGKANYEIQFFDSPLIELLRSTTDDHINGTFEISTNWSI